MIRVSRWTGLLLAVALFGSSGCSPERPEIGGGREASAAGDEKLSVYVVHYPLQYFAERIGGDRVRVEFPVPPSADPAYWSPDAEVIAGYQQADVILLNGAGYAGWVEKVSLPAAALVNTSAGVRDRWLVVEGAATHSHGPEGEHSHGATAFTIWLDLKLALEQARVIERLFTHRIPDGAEEFQANLAALEADLTSIDGSLEQLGETIRQPLLGSHPVYQYLAAGYGLDIVSVHFEPDGYPSAEAWAELESLLKERPARWMLWEAEPEARTAERLRELGVESVVYAPCANAPADGDFLSVARANLESLRRISQP